MGPADTWKRTEAWLRSIASSLPEAPKAILVVSAHWEEEVPTVTTTAPQPPLLFDYYGFPEHTYELTWPAAGSPPLAARVVELLSDAGIATKQNDARGFDHGVFVPLKVAFPEAQIPTVQLSMRAGLDPAEHLAIGRALTMRPKLLVLDEPTEGIQPSVIKDIGRAITYLRNRGDMAILLVERYLDFAHELADDFAVMDRGEIVMSGTRETFDADAVRKHMTV